MTIIEKAREMRHKIELAATMIPEEDAADYVDLYPEWAVGAVYAVGSRVRYGGELYKCLQAHTSQSDWAPDVAVSLWARILPGQDGTKIDEWKQPNSTNVYSRGQKVIHNGQTWMSDINNNSYEPGVYGWSIYEEE